MRTSPAIAFCCKFFLLWIGSVSVGMGQDITFNHLSIDQNLSQSSVYAITQDTQDFMWFGTRDGLNRYDSRRNVVYRQIAGDSTSLSSNSVNAITLDKQGKLWIGTSRGLNLYRPRTDNFQRIFSNTSAHTLSHNNISVLLQATDGSLWIGTRNGLSRLKDPDSMHFERYLMHGNEMNKSGAFDIKALYEDTRQHLWVGTSRGLIRLIPQSAGGYQVAHYILHEQDSVWHSGSNWVNAIAEDGHGRLWVGTETRGIALFDPGSGKVIGWNPVQGLDMSDFTIRTIKTDDKGRFWIGTMSGLIVCRQDGEGMRRYINSPDQPGSLSDNSIRAIHRGRDGTVWIGTFYGGVSYYHSFARQFGAMNVTNQAGRKPFKIAGPIIEGPDGCLWLGSDDNGLILSDRNDRVLAHYVHDPDRPHSLSSNKIKCLLKNGDKGLWIGTLKGLNYLDFASRKITRYLTEPHNPRSIPDDRIYDLAYDRQGQLWIATFRGGLCRMHPETGRFEHFPIITQSGEILSLPSATSLLIDRNEGIWIGTTNGLAYKPGDSRQFTIYKTAHAKAGTLSGNYIIDLFEDSEGRVWISTRGAGLNRFDPATGKFSHFSKADGLGGDNVFGVREDGAGNLWIATDNGLSRLHLQSGRITSYDRNDGLVCKEFLPHSAFRSGQGELYFGGYDGIVRFDPGSIRQNPGAPSVVFTGMRLFNKPLAIEGPDGILDEHLHHKNEIRLNHRQNVFSIEFASINYIDAQKNQYAYLLEGFENEWNYVQEPVATYMNLEPGSYTLRVKGSNNHDVWNSRPIEMQVVILPPPWKTTWAYLLYVLVFLSLLYTWSRYHRERLQLSHNLELEQLEKHQQEELHRTRIHFFTNIIHEIRTPLTLIIGPIKILEEEQASDPWLKRQLEVMKGSTNRLMRLVEQLLDFQKHEMGNVLIRVREMHLEAWLEAIAADFQSYAVSRRIDLEVMPSARPTYLWMDPDEMEKVFHNLLINAFKFTPTGGKIRISTRPGSENHISILVEDNGIGISAEETDRIFRRFYQAGNPHNQGFGIGLALCKSIVELHHGTIVAESAEAGKAENSFTRFVITLPLGKDAYRPEEITDWKDLPAPLRRDFPSEENLSPDQAGTAPGAADKAPGGVPLILVIEDQDDIRSYLRDLLSGRYEIAEAANGAAGWELASTILPDLIISDISMPFMDGIALTNLVKTDERTNHIPVILLTAYDSLQQQLKGLEKGADDYIAKPFHPKVLLTRVRNLLRIREELKEKFRHKVRLEPTEPDASPHPDSIFLQKLMQVIEDNISNPEFNLAGLVLEMGMSRPVLFRKIKMLTDCSVMDLVRSVRMKKAEMLLKQKTMSVSEVAFAVGFNDPKYFSKSFRSQFGKTPSDYLAG